MSEETIDSMPRNDEFVGLVIARVLTRSRLEGPHEVVFI